MGSEMCIRDRAYKVETNELENALIKEVTKLADQKRNTILKG